MSKYLSNKTSIAFLFLFGLTLWLGCSKSEDPKDPPCTVSGVTFTYDSNIKGIIDRRCISCHATGSGVTGADIFDFTTYAGMKDHLDEGHVLERVVVLKDMPQANATNMTPAERDSVNCWIQAGYPEK